MPQQSYRLLMSGMTISSPIQNSIRIIMENLVNKSPSDGQLALHIDMGESQVNGFLSISSQAITLDFSQCGEDPLNVVQLLSKDLLIQIVQWKSKRAF